MRYLLGIDVEDWFHVENLRGAVRRESWPTRERRVAANVDWLLDVLRRFDTRATFFVLGWVAEDMPELVGRIHADGHEIASHGYGHELVYGMSRAEFRDDVRRSKELLEALTGEGILGYRAPSFSITDWATDELADLGFLYDSSFFPSRHDRYGRLSVDAQGASFELPNGLIEIPMSYLRLGGRNIPWAGGGYFRMYPYPLFAWGARAIARGGAYNFYLHPWELDPDQPRIEGIPWSYRFRHYHNLAATKRRLTRLLASFSFEPLGSLVRAPSPRPAVIP